MANLLVHYMDARDNESIAEIDANAFHALIKTEHGHDLARKLDAALKITNTDPRVSELDATDIWVSYSDVFTGLQTADDLLNDLPMGMLG